MSSSVTPSNSNTKEQAVASSVGEFVSESITGKSSRKWQNLLAITDSKELNQDYTSVYSTCALVGALIMSFLSATTDADADELGNINMYGPKYTVWAIEVNQVLVVLCFSISLLILFLSAIMLTQLAHVPESQTKELFVALGDTKVHAPLAHMQKLLSLYAFHFLLTTTIYYRMITSIICISVGVLTVIYCIWTAHLMVEKKKRVLEKIRASTL